MVLLPAIDQDEELDREINEVCLGFTVDVLRAVDDGVVVVIGVKDFDEPFGFPFCEEDNPVHEFDEVVSVFAEYDCDVLFRHSRSPAFMNRLPFLGSMLGLVLWT